MIFPALAFIVVLTSAVLSLFGVIPADGSIFSILFSSDSIQKILTKVLTGLWNSKDIFGSIFGVFTIFGGTAAIIAGYIYNRDEPIYGGLGVLFFKMLGLYSLFTWAGIPAGLEPVMLTVVGLFNTLFVISFINWIRGRGE
jgi:hypothetical protein